MGRCCVEGCEDLSSKDITYFNFPTKKDLRRKWISAISPTLKPKSQTVVCSRHFLSEECESARGRTRLRPGAVPSVFHQTKQKRKASTKDTTKDIPPNSTTTAEEETKNSDHHIDDDEAKNDEEKSHHHNDEIPPETKLQDEEIVSGNGNSNEKDEDTKNNKEKLKDATDKSNDTVNENEKISDENIKSSTEKLKDTTEQSNDTEKLQDATEEIEETKGKLKEKNLRNKRKNLHEKLNALQNKNQCVDPKRIDKDGSSSEKETLLMKDTDLSKKQNIDVDDDTKSCDENVQESEKSVQNGNQDRSKESASEKQPEDIEELLTNYTILQDRPLHIHAVTEPRDQPVFIEISVDKDNTNVEAGKSDCMMVMESVQVELDPSELMLPQEYYEIDDTPIQKEDPISLLTSSDEDDVIIEEPHIDTVEVSDETDEDDMPLVKLLKRRRAEKVPQKVQKKEEIGEPDIAKILWGMYEYYCVQCHYTTSSGTEYRKHTASHAKVLMMCQICGYMTASESQFTKHEKQHGEKKYKCHLCSYKAKHNMSLLYHLKGHKAEDFIKTDLSMLKRPRPGGLFECVNCAYTTKKRCDLKRHMTRRHKNDEDKDEDFIP